MAQTYTQIQRQIEALQRQAEKLKSQEVTEVISRIQVAIEHYGLTAEQLFGGNKTKLKPSTKMVAGNAARRGAAAYVDENGNTWGGRGPRPKWLRDAIAGGKKIEEFAASASSTKSAARAAKSTVGKTKVKRKAKASYRDEAGNSWSGFGPKPAWLKAALAAGKSINDFVSIPSQSSL